MTGPLHGVVACVDCADLLRWGLPAWARNLDSVTVVTAPHDAETLRLAAAAGPGVRCHTTDAFYRQGASFNKGAALAEALEESVPYEGWIIAFDADIVPPAHLRSDLTVRDQCPPFEDSLYGAVRYQCPRLPISAADLDDWQDDAAVGRLPVLPAAPGDLPGWFHLWHTSAVPRGRTYDRCWPHAGNYDTAFALRWPIERRIILGRVRCLHLGEPRRWWHGRGPDAERRMADMLAERRRRGGWRHERISGV